MILPRGVYVLGVMLICHEGGDGADEVAAGFEYADAGSSVRPEFEPLVALDPAGNSLVIAFC
ncbi:MAG: hypothetical protein UH229_02795, partial [Lachnospiraceae bacterium]|nr:hypothetical protein [Lachnospiraceae bacterium]